MISIDLQRQKMILITTSSSGLTTCSSNGVQYKNINYFVLINIRSVGEEMI
jgi:hypothetical protein